MQKKRLTCQQKRGINEDSAYFNEFEHFAIQVRKNIEKLRKKKGLSQEQMQDFEINLRQFQRIECGETKNITLGNLFKLAKAFGIRPAQLIDV